jgi:hypothetical protein
MIGLIPVAAIAWYIPHRLRQSALAVERELMFEDLPNREFELLRIAE